MVSGLMELEPVFTKEGRVLQLGAWPLSTVSEYLSN